MPKEMSGSIYSLYLARKILSVSELGVRLYISAEEQDALAARIINDDAEISRLTTWLRLIEGGYNHDAATLRRWAYEAITLGKPA